jgi:uncharacterized protein
VSIQPKAKTLKTFNDPIYGFITIEDALIFKIIEHPYFQRLRRITQLGLTNLVYGGANHSRFQHTMGAMNLMKQAIATLRTKGFEITEEEERASKLAILMHDIGHGPFSHALENTIVRGVHHEAISLQIMHDLNAEFDGALSLAIQIYEGTYHVKFLHQLVSSQLDTDRLDYLKRDSFFTGVSEGVISSERIIKMLTIHDGELAVEAKGIYSVEKFLIARRLMYWQVYLHKTVLSAEFLLMNILLRAKELAQSGTEVPAPFALDFFLKQNEMLSLKEHANWLPLFLKLDDVDVMAAIKQWTNHEDHVLRELCNRLLYRRLLKTKELPSPLSVEKQTTYQAQLAEKLGWTVDETRYLFFERSLTNTAYNPESEMIKILLKDGTLRDISEAATIFRFSSLAAQETKNYLYFPENMSLA